MKAHRFFESGSVLVWLLVGVGLFAALGFAVSQDMRGGGTEVLTREVAKNHATEIIQFASTLRRAVQTMRIDGITDTEISFENYFAAGYANAKCSSESCEVFSPEGGGLTYIKTLKDWLLIDHSSKDHFGTWLFSGSSCIAFVGTGGTDCDTDIDTGTEELILFLPYLKRNICMEINKKLGFNLPDGLPLEEGGDAWDDDADQAKFSGSYINHAEIGDTATDYQKVREACFVGSAAGTPGEGTYNYYKVLLAR
jgi:hypothetical protein